MIVGDTAYQDRVRWRRTVERTRQLAQDSIAHQAWQVKDTLVSKTARGDANPTNPLDQMGKPMTSNQLISILQKCNPNIIFKDSLADKTKLQVMYPDKEKQPDGGESVVLRFLCAMEKGFMPEFSILPPKYDTCWESEKKNLQQTLTSVRETRGWRTVVGRCMRARLITKEQVKQYFGHAARKNWHEWMNAAPLR